MKKFTAKIMCALLITGLVFATTPYISHADDSDAFYCYFVASAFGREFATNYAQALELIASFYEYLPTDRTGRVIYPNDFGGLYLNELGELVVLFVESTQNMGANGAMQILTLENVNSRPVVFSYNDLRNAFDFLDYFIPNAPDNVAATNVDGITFDVKSNLILVSLAVYCNDKILLFTEMVLDAPFIIFHASPGIPSLSYAVEDVSVHEDTNEYTDAIIMPLSTPSIRTGDRLYFRNSSGTLVWGGSVGYRANINIHGRGDQLGFVTAAHLGNVAFGRQIRFGDRVYNGSGQHVGTVQQTHLDTIDAAFFTLASGVTGSNVTARGAILGRIEHTPIGGPVILDARNVRDRTGVIRANWSGNTSGGFWISGARASYQSQHGDSGGIVYSWTNAANNGVAGIQIATFFGDNEWADGGNSVFTRANLHSSLIGHQLSPR